METLPGRSLLNLEDLVLPSFQVIILTANIRCVGCRRRLSQLISKMTGLTEYTIDLRSEQVVIKGGLRHHHNGKDALESKLKKEWQSLKQCFYTAIGRSLFGSTYLSYMTCFFLR